MSDNFKGWKNAFEVLLGKPIGKATEKAKKEAGRELKKMVGMNKGDDSLIDQFLSEVVGGPWSKD